MNKMMISAICIVLLIVGFLGGLTYAEYTGKFQDVSYFRIEGHFNNFQPTGLSLFDGDYPYFTYNTGATTEQAEDYKMNPQNYAAYEADIFLTNNSDYDIEDVWAVLPGTAMCFAPLSPDAVQEIQPLSNRKIWLDAWMEEGWTSLYKGETFKGKLHIIVKKEGLSDSDIHELLSSMTIHIQAGIAYSADKMFLPDKRLCFDTPIYYKP